MFANFLGMEFVRIEPGRFMMGAVDLDPDADENERPRHLAVVERPYFLARCQVTLGQYQQLASYKIQECSAWADDHAVNFISCLDADRWVTVLNAAKPEAEQKLIYRLPTECEWEYACRAGSGSRFFFGHDPDCEQLGEYAWFAGNTWDVGARHPHPVGRKKPNSFGLFDMHGNVWEWTTDGWALYDEILTRGETARNLDLRVLRGGAWCHEGHYQRASDRDFYEPGYCHYYTGFRICCDIRGIGTDEKSGGR